VTTGLALMAYGSPRRQEDIAAYYTDIRRGRPPSAEQLADLTRRYDAIGGLSPLVERTEAQRTMLARELERFAPGRFVVQLGFRHSEPTIEDAVEALAGVGAADIAGLVLAPHYSAMSVAVYLERAGKAAAACGLTFTGIESWATEPAYVELLASDVAACLAHPDVPPRTKVVFTAHSLPRRILASDDRYLTEVSATAGLVAAEARLADDRWSIAWQSAGRTSEPWLEPDLLGVIDALGADDEVDGVLVCPCGFVADHLEVLYDLDIEAAARAAAAAGLRFRRTRVVNDDSGVMSALARRIVAACGS
jgi:ferrochelatase